MSSIPETDWKLFRKLQKELTAKACELVFAKVEKIAQERNGQEHQSYLELYKLIKTEDAKIAEMFDNPTRSNLLLKLIPLKGYGVLSEEQFKMFSQETQERINSILMSRY